MSDLDLYADLITRKLVSRDGGAVTLPTFVLGDTLRCTLRTFERNEAGDLRERDLRVCSVRASIGRVLSPPTVGWFKLWIGNTDTPEINFDASADAFQTAAQGSGIIDTVESPASGTWVVKTTRPDTAGVWPISIHTNKLGPESFVRVRQFKQLGVWWFECRLIQAPLAFNNGHERVLPAPPTVRRIRAGDSGSETQPPSNEIQALHLPPDFRGTYFLRWNYRVSKLLGIDDGPDEIATALNAMFGSGKRFEATNPEPDNAYVEFYRRTSRLPATAHHRRGEHLRAGCADIRDAAGSRADGRGAACCHRQRSAVRGGVGNRGRRRGRGRSRRAGAHHHAFSAGGESDARANLGGTRARTEHRLAPPAATARLHPVHARPDHRRRAALRLRFRRRRAAFVFLPTQSRHRGVPSHGAAKRERRPRAHARHRLHGEDFERERSGARFPAPMARRASSSRHRPARSM